MEKTRKQISFDLDTKALKEYYPKGNWREAYQVIKNHMKTNGFIWQQGSVYVSKKEIETLDIAIMLKKLIKQNPWLHKCMRDCKIAEIGKEYNQNHLFNKNAKIPKRQDIKPAIKIKI